MKDYNIRLKYPPLFWLGDRFYKVEPKVKNYSMEHRFVSICPSCNNTRKIRYTGYDKKEYEAECPVCKGSIGRGYGNTITLKEWEVSEYIVYRIEAEGPTTRTVYKDGIGYIESMQLMAFKKYGRCNEQYITCSVPWNSNYVDQNVKDIHLDRSPEDYVFRNKKDAENLCAVLKEYDKKRLEEFNKTYNTDYEYPF